MDFRKYNTIDNSYQEDFIRDIIEQGLGDGAYVVQEKVHGANMSFFTNGQQILVAKRTEWIAEDEEFYNWKAVLENHRERILLLYKDVRTLYDVSTITVYGELFGGGYPHPEVPKDERAKLVQRGIYYAPSNDFYGFDILVDGKNFLDTETANSLFVKNGFIHARTLFTGSLSACLAQSNTFKTTIPKEYQLAELDGNICEGIVIRPVEPRFFRSGSRVLIKNKNEQWAENNRYIDQEILSKLLHEGEELSEEASFLCEELYRLITINRLANVVSKIGEVNPKKDMGKVLGLYNKDVLTDFLKTHQDAYNALEKHESKAVTKFLNKQSGLLIEAHFRD